MKKFLLIMVFISLSSAVWGQSNVYIVDLDGDESFYVNDDVNDNLDITGSYTFEAWINVDNFQNADRIFDRRYVCDLSIVTANGSGDYDIRFTERNSSDVDLRNIFSGDDLLLDTWYHVAVTFDGSTIKMFINGDLVRSDAEALWSLSSSGTAINIGGRYWGSYDYQIDARIDELRISDVARDIGDMQTSTTNTKYVSDANTVLLMNLDVTDAPPTYVSGTGLTGTIGDDPDFSSADYIAYDDASLGGATLPLGSPVPVQLTSFSASTTDAGVVLNWETATEVNNYGFDIQRSTNSDEFETIGFVDGHGNSNSPNSYSFVDNSTSGKVSYRLKQIDTDGAFEYSDIIEVVGENLDKLVFGQNYPNPFNPSTTFLFSIPSKEFVTLAIYNSLGEKVAEIVSKEMQVGNYEYNWNAGNLTSGVYFARLTAGANVQVQKIALLK